MEIRNTTKRPLKVPLPGGKRLFLGIGATGQITPKTVDHPAVKALLDAGDLELTEGGRSGRNDNSSGRGTIRSSQSHGGSSGVRQSGDR
jgi:hypothetical protein